ncbi:MAG: PilZ domain-containing protein [Hyphomicrobiales bacterium]
MAKPEVNIVSEPASPEAALELSGRYMNANQMEFPCTLDSIDLPDLRINTTGEYEPGERVIVYLEELGRLEGDVREETDEGFVLCVDMNKPRLVKINERLKSLQNRKQGENADELRRHPRFSPAKQTSHLTLSDGRTYPCEVVDISVSGAAINVDVIPALGTYVMLGKMRGRITRILDTGIAIEFVRVLDKSVLNETLA